MIHNILQYWRNSLVDGNRIQRLEHQVPVDLKSIETGNIGPKLAKMVKDKYRAAARYEKDRGREVEEASAVVPVLVCPICLKKKHTHYEKTGFGDEKIPLWLPAVMTEAGELRPAEAQVPWIARDLLEPKSNKDITIGDMEDIENFLSRRSLGEIWSSWGNFYAFAEDMLRAMPEGELNFHDYTPTGESYIMPDIEVRGAAMHAILLLDYIIHYNIKIPPLLRRVATINEQKPVPLLTPEERCKVSLKHIGQMGNRFALNESQREALHHCLNMEHGEIIAVNGPPGTGKTTLMHSVIASLWTEAALKQTDPPVIVAASSNNQAVTNMIDSFGRISGDTEGLLSERWIPEVNSYGLYCPSATAAAKKESEGYQMASPSNNDFPSNSHFPAVVEAPDFIPKAEGYFLDCVTRYFGKEYNSVKKALQALHGELRTCLEQLSEFAGDPDAADKVGVLLEKYRAKYGLDLNKIPDHLVKEMVRLSKQEKAIKALLFEQHKQYEKNKKMQEWLEDITREWRDHKENEPWYLKVFGSLLKPIQEKRDIYFFKAHGNDRVTSENLESTLQWLQRQPVETTKALNTIELRMKELNDELSYCKNQLASVKEDSLDVEKAMGEWAVLKESVVQEKYDIEVRYKAFLFATHYWEARWLLEIRDMQKLAGKPISLKERIKRKWRRYSMLTPCIVSTLFVIPRLFSSFTFDHDDWLIEPLLDFVDLLIIDEAGQVNPELAAAAFALSQKAVIVGDVMQIEPIYKITRFVDQGNLKSHGVTENNDQYEDQRIKSLSASRGSVMLLAQKACRYEKDEEKGLFLSEHRRCQNEIISYSNDLAYGGRLIPMRGNEPGPLPPFGYLHITGASVKSGSSRKNEMEAKAIFDWILSNRKLLEKYGPLKESVAIIMPFSEQKKAFVRLSYNKKYLPLKEITIGTVHALQGAERDVVIFSPVYTDKDGNPDDFFFNRDVRMLNVAVSRAKNSFIVMGDTRVFNPKSNKPSGLLARRLFNKERKYNLAELPTG